jgi:hypothetical protein
LSLEIGIQKEMFIEPYATHLSVVELYRELASRRKNLPQLSRLTVEVGAKRKLAGGYPVSWVLWEQGERVTFHVTPTERLENTQKGWLDVECTTEVMPRRQPSFISSVGGDDTVGHGIAKQAHDEFVAKSSAMSRRWGAFRSIG